MNNFGFAILIAFLGLVAFNNLKAQIPCPSPDPCPDTTWNTGTFRDHIGTYGAYMDYEGTYLWRRCNGVYQIKDFHVTVNGGSAGLWNDQTRFQEHFSGLLEFAEIQSLNKLINDLGVGNIPDCPTTIPFATIYSAACGVWLRCSYEFPCNPLIHADGPSQTGYQCPPPWNYNGHPTVDVWHYEPCGDICCEKTYSICKQSDPHYGGYQIVISNVNRHRLAGSNCSKQNQFHRWNKNPGDQDYYIECVDGCQGDGY